MGSLLLWISAISLLFIVFILVFTNLKSAFLYFSGMDVTNLLVENVSIPLGDIHVRGKIIRPRFALDEGGKVKEQLPLIFLNPGWGMGVDSIMFLQWAFALAMGGPYAILAYDCRGFGKGTGKKKLDEKILDDMPAIFEFGLNLDNIDRERVGFMGHSFGGMVALSRVYPDVRFKAIVAGAALHDAKENFSRKPESFLARVSLGFLRLMGVNGKNITDEINKQISPKYILHRDRPDLNGRVFLIHAKDDPTIKFQEFEKNRELLDLNDDQVLVLEKGGHALFKQELSILSVTLRFFKTKLR
ncbi:MAG: alpha/beta hydrolase family protein [Promethearchaeota archaeon]